MVESISSQVVANIGNSLWFSDLLEDRLRVPDPRVAEQLVETLPYRKPTLRSGPVQGQGIIGIIPWCVGPANKGLGPPRSPEILFAPHSSRVLDWRLPLRATPLLSESAECGTENVLGRDPSIPRQGYPWRGAPMGVWRETDRARSERTECEEPVSSIPTKGYVRPLDPKPSNGCHILPYRTRANRDPPTGTQLDLLTHPRRSRVACRAVGSSFPYSRTRS